MPVIIPGPSAPQPFRNPPGLTASRRSVTSRRPVGTNPAVHACRAIRKHQLVIECPGLKSRACDEGMKIRISEISETPRARTGVHRGEHRTRLASWGHEVRILVSSAVTAGVVIGTIAVIRYLAEN